MFGQSMIKWRFQFNGSRLLRAFPIQINDHKEEIHRNCYKPFWVVKFYVLTEEENPTATCKKLLISLFVGDFFSAHWQNTFKFSWDFLKCRYILWLLLLLPPEKLKIWFLLWELRRWNKNSVHTQSEASKVDFDEATNREKKKKQQTNKNFWLEIWSSMNSRRIFMLQVQRFATHRL